MGSVFQEVLCADGGPALGWRQPTQLKTGWACFKNLVELFTVLSHHSFPFSPPLCSDNSLSRFPASCQVFQL